MIIMVYWISRNIYAHVVILWGTILLRIFFEKKMIFFRQLNQILVWCRHKRSYKIYNCGNLSVRYCNILLQLQFGYY